ncbi:DUF4907 domain-containing protein [Flagellimonas sp. DF-77]|uniref:DUF4907 domain-containing protein n=1 Tax=Flagellimonas algarum TaxID=3230298 RepID=UPI0033987D86
MVKAKYALWGLGALLLMVMLWRLFIRAEAPGKVEEGAPYELVVERNPHHGHWRYEIHIEGRMMLRQEWIPGVNGHQNFRDKEEAGRIGQLVLEKLLKGHPPGISRKELIENGISFK